MAEMVEGRTKTFTAGGAIGANLLVKLSSGVLAVAGVTDLPIGVSREAAFASGDVIAVTLLNAQGTIKMKAAGAIAANALVYGRASGLVDDTNANSALQIGIALPQPGQTTVAASAANDIVEVMPVFTGTI